MKLIAILIYFLVLGKNPNYELYHEKIYKAELMFLNGDFKKSIELYHHLFNEFEFIFAKDAMIALQIAMINKDEMSFLHFTKIAMNFGVEYDCITQLANLYIKENNLEPKILSFQKESRETFLKRIDLAKHSKYSKLYTIEQYFKKQSDNTDYINILSEKLRSIEKDIESDSFPGEYLIGIDMKTDIGRDYCQCSNEIVLITLYHYPCSYTKFANDLIPLIQEGKIHPKDVAYLLEYECELNKNNHNRFRNTCSPQSYYSNPISIDYNINTKNKITDEINECRRYFYLPPLEHDLDKKLFAEIS